MLNYVGHPYHIVSESPWPLVSAISALGLTMGMVKWFKTMDSTLFLLGLVSTTLAAALWWSDITKEATFLGDHPRQVEDGLRWGMILFILSEVMFFASFFSSLSYYWELIDEVSYEEWTPLGISSFDPLLVPTLNSVILITSGVSATWAHHAIMEGQYDLATSGLKTTLLLGGYFTMVQYTEYTNSSFTMADGLYGSCFFMFTGFHGIHVILGSLFLFVCLYRLSNCHFTELHHFGFEAAAWYWHFVDVVWLFLYLTVYFM